MALLRQFLGQFKIVGTPTTQTNTQVSNTNTGEEKTPTHTETNTVIEKPIPKSNPTISQTPKSNPPPTNTVKSTPPPTTNIPTTNTPPPQDNSETTGAVKKIMNEVFKKVRGKVTAGTNYVGTGVLDTMKELIKETTLATSATSTEQEIAAIKSIMNNVFKTIKSSFQPEQDYDGQEVLDSIKGAIVKITNDLLNTPPVTNNTPNSNNPPPDQSVKQNDSLGPLNAGIETQRREAEARINKNPGDKELDLTDQVVLDYYVRVRNDDDPLTWVMYGYGQSKNRLQVISFGEGGFNEMKENVPDVPVFVYFKFVFGDTGRSKFIYVNYIPDSISPIQKSKLLGHKAAFIEFVKYFHLSWDITDKSDSEFEEEMLIKKLLSAGGANYSVQETNKGNFSSYKTNTKNFYSEKEKSGSNTKIVYSQTPLALTPIDISGRPTVAPTTQFLGNTSKDLKK